MSNYFIMLNAPRGDGLIVMTNEEEEVMMFETIDGAREMVSDHRYAQAFGYEIFEKGTGEN